MPRIRITYIAKENQGHQPGRILKVWFENSSQQPLIGEFGGSPEQPTCINTTEWVDVTSNELNEILNGEKTIDIHSKNKIKLKNDKDWVRKLCKFVKDIGAGNIEDEDLSQSQKDELEYIRSNVNKYHKSKRD